MIGDCLLIYGVNSQPDMNIGISCNEARTLQSMAPIDKSLHRARSLLMAQHHKDFLSVRVRIERVDVLISLTRFNTIVCLPLFVRHT